MFFQGFEAPEGRKVGSAPRQMRRELAGRWTKIHTDSTERFGSQNLQSWHDCAAFVPDCGDRAVWGSKSLKLACTRHPGAESLEGLHILCFRSADFRGSFRAAKDFVCIG